MSWMVDLRGKEWDNGGFCQVWLFMRASVESSGVRARSGEVLMVKLASKATRNRNIFCVSRRL